MSNKLNYCNNTVRNRGVLFNFNYVTASQSDVLAPLSWKYNLNALEKPIHTYIHNWPLQPFNHTYVVCVTTYVVCVNFKHEWRDLQLTLNTER